MVATALGVAAAALIVYVTAPGFAASPEKFDLTVTMLRITFPYILFISLVSLAAGILNTWSRFAVPAFTPTLLNVAFIVGALLFARHFDPPVLVLAWAVLAGGVLQLALQIPALARIGMLPRPRLALGDPGVRRILVLMGPAVIGVSAGQINLLLNTIFASTLRDRERVVALLRRPPDGVPDRPAGRGARHHPAAQPRRRRSPTARGTNTRPCSTGACG